MTELLGWIHNLSLICQKIESLSLTCDMASHERGSSPIHFLSGSISALHFIIITVLFIFYFKNERLDYGLDLRQ
jgi:hypothetical protein